MEVINVSESGFPERESPYHWVGFDVEHPIAPLLYKNFDKDIVRLLNNLLEMAMRGAVDLAAIDKFVVSRVDLETMSAAALYGMAIGIGQVDERDLAFIDLQCDRILRFLNRDGDRDWEVFVMNELCLRWQGRLYMLVSDVLSWIRTGLLPYTFPQISQQCAKEIVYPE